MPKSKTRISLSIFLALVMLFHSFSPALAVDPYRHPAAKPPANLKADYQTDLFTGSAGYSYPIKVPKGTGDLTPNVSFSYNSSSAFASSSYVGMGWELNRDYVERDVNYTPDNSDTSDDKFRLRFQGGVYDLVYVASEGRYHTKIESNLYITKLTTGEDNESNEYWQVITPDGTKYRFGQSNGSEQMCNGRSYSYRWNLDLVTDVHDNKIYYTYSENNGASYLSQIKYNNDQSRIIDFTYDTTSSDIYKRQAYMQGCNVKEEWRLNDVKVKINTSLVRQFDFGYAIASNSGQLLQSITEKGSDGTSALPPTRFDYKPETKSFQELTPPWLNGANVDVHLEKNDVTLADVNGDSLLDIVRTQNNGYYWDVLINQGNSWSTQLARWGNGLGSAYGLDSNEMRLVDVTGDNLPDVVRTHWFGGDHVDWIVWRNTGSSWNTSGEYWHTGSNRIGEIYLALPNVALTDVNGDNLADIVHSVNHSHWYVYLNTGNNSWSTTSETWASSLNAKLGDANTRFMDVTGDGLPDIIKTSYSGSNATWNVYKNTGSSWDNSPETWINNANIDAHLEQDSVALSDVNGDGLIDIVKTVVTGSNDIWKVLYNKGNGWSTSYETWLDNANVDADLPNDHVEFMDVTGDGLPDIVKGTPDCSCSQDTWKVWKNNSKAPHLLQTIYSPQGGTTKFDYTSSGTFDNTGSDSLSDLPFSLWVVEKMTVNNGMIGSHQTNDITTYTYKDGLYDYQDKEFRGFIDVNTTEPNGSKRKYVFNQDDVLKGTMEEVQHRNSSNDPFIETDNTWSVSTTSGVMTIKLDSEQFITYDATTSGAKTIQNDYTYDSYGNVTKKSELGDTSTSSDNRYIYNEYTYNTTDWIVNTPKRTYLNKSDDSTKVSESWFYYDNNLFWTSAPTKGDVTKEEKWLSGGTNTTIQYAYDMYGNQTSVTDANNHTTTTAYDATTHTYPISTTNAKNQTTSLSYDLGTGNLLSKIDPNGLSSSYEYDVFGRITKEIKPGDSSTYPSTSYSYYLDGIAPEGMLISKTETASSSATLDMYTFVDGLGRKIQTRVDAEDTSKHRVTDTFYDSTGEMKKETVPYIATSSAVIITPPSATKFGDGSDGDLTVSSNTTEAPIDSSVTATSGNTTATVSAGLGFSVNQIVLFHQTKGTNAGIWELRRVLSYSGTTLKLTTPLTNSYSSSGNNKAQVRVVPQYNDVTVNSGVTWTAKAWNGTTGGIFAFLANGTVTVTGTVSANGANGYNYDGSTATINQNGGGFRGGGNDDATGAAPSGDGPAVQGEGSSGVAGTFSTSANGTGGGGGSSSGGGAGGGGGGYANTGANGNTTGSATGGTGGSTSGSADLTTMTFGGGAGGATGAGGNDAGAYGGNGGGIIFISGASLSVTGSITAKGGNGGGTGGGSTGSGGGGGAGGSILIKSETATLGTSLLTATGGTGGNGNGSGASGGAGSSGRIRVDYEMSLSGSTNPTASTSQNTIPQIPAGTSVAYATYGTPDASAKYTEFTYDAIGRPTIINNPKGDSKTIAYDHWKETTIDENGHIKREYKNAFDKIWKVEEVNGANTYTTTYEYDSRDLLTKITDHLSNESTFTYDSLGRKTSQVDPDMGTWSYGYDAVGNLTSQTDNRGVTTTKTYDELDRVTLVNYPSQTDNSFTYDIGKIGTLSIATDSAGTVNYSYDNRLRKTQEQRSINGTAKTTQFAYDAMDRLNSQTYPDGEVVNFSFNNQGEIESASGSASLLTNVDYNALGKITKKDFGNGLTTNYSYNLDDFRLSNITTGSVQNLSYTYDNVGNVASRINNVTSKTEMFSYDDLDRLKTASESAGYNYAYDYNAIGNLTKFTNAGIDIDYTYGSGSAIPHALTSSTESATPSARPPTFTENWSSGSINGSNWNDWGGAQTSVVSQELNIDSTTSSNYFGVDLLTNYDLTGSYVSNQLVNAGNQSLTSWEVDPIYVGNSNLSNAVFVIVLNNNLWVQRRVNNVDTYDNMGAYNSSTHQYFRIRESGGTTYVDTSANGTTWSNLHSFANPFDLTSLTIGMAAGTYQSEGSTTNARLDNFVYSTVPTAELTDEWTNIDTSKWTDWGGAQTSIASNQLQIDSTTASNYFGLDSVATYDLTESQVTTQLVNAGNQSLTSWEVDPIYIGNSTLSNAIFVIVLNNTLWIQKRVNNVDTYENKGAYNSNTHKYFKIRETGGTTYVDTSADGKSWSNLDSFANLFDLTHVKVGVAAGTYQAEGSTTSAIFDNLNILPSGKTYTYDANGNMTSDGTNCYQYNQANQLDKVTKCSNGETIAEYVYDYNGNRMVKRNFTSGLQTNSVVSWSDAFETTVATSGAQLSSQSYYFVNNEFVAKKNNDGSRNFFHNDHLGSASVISSASGTLVESTTYDPWGEITAGGTASKFLYTGQEKDGETGLHYYNARYYDSHVRKFTQPDDIVQDIYDPQSLNRYSYVRNNPLRYTDPTGHCFQKGAGFWGTLISSAISCGKAAISIIAKPAPKAPPVKPNIPAPVNISRNVSRQAASVKISNPPSATTTNTGTGFTSNTSGQVAGQRIGTIYKEMNKSNVTTYIGKTTNFERRYQQWRRLGREMEKIPGLEKLPEEHLSGVEQAAILRHGLGKHGGTLKNKINSISPNNPIYQGAVEIGNKYLDDIEY